MKRYIRLLKTHQNDNEHLNAVMFEDEDLCINDEEREARRLLTWLNKRGTTYTIRVSPQVKFPKPIVQTGGNGTNGISFSTFSGSFVVSHDLSAPTLYYDIHLDDDETCTLLRLFFENFKIHKDEPPKEEVQFPEEFLKPAVFAEEVVEIVPELVAMEEPKEKPKSMWRKLFPLTK